MASDVSGLSAADQKLVKEITLLRTTFKKNSRLSLEFRALLSQLFRQHGMQVSDELLHACMLGIEPEICADGHPIITPEVKSAKTEAAKSPAKAAEKKKS